MIDADRFVIRATVSGYNGVGQPSVSVAMHPDVREMGWPDANDDLVERPPRSHLRYSMVKDRFLHIVSGAPCSLGRVVVSEELVYDLQFRATIALVGVGVTISLNEDAYSRYCEYVFDMTRPDRGGTGALPSQQPVAVELPFRPFRFPAPRGSDKPWDTPQRELMPMRTIAQTTIDAMRIVPLGNGERYYQGKEPSLTLPPLVLEASPANRGPIARIASALFG